MSTHIFLCICSKAFSFTLELPHQIVQFYLSGCIVCDSKRRKRQHVDDHSDYSGSLRNPNEPEDEAKEARSVFQKQV